MDVEGGSMKGHIPPSMGGSGSGLVARTSTSAVCTTTTGATGTIISQQHSVSRRVKGVVGRKRPLADARFSAYLSFGVPTTICLGIFLFCYAVLLLGLSPLLNQAPPATVPTKHFQVLRPVVEHAVEHIQQYANKDNAALRHEAQQLAGHVADAIQRKIAVFRNSKGVNDASLLQKAIVDMDKLRSRRQQAELKEGAGDAADTTNAAAAGGKPAAAALNRNPQLILTGKQVKQRSGFVVLGMHRSGTSMLSGLMSMGFGYHTGGPLIGSAYDNEKGFFELVPAVLQNDVFLESQRIWWSAGVYEYDWKKAYDDKVAGRIKFKEGARALRVLNHPDQIPFLQKDPRMCITLKTWLPLLNSEPAVVFTYRHPLEVAKSLEKRENSFTLEQGLRLWIVYNMRAIQNSADLCRVTTSNEAILENPLHEVQRISKELTTRCRVAPPPNPFLAQEEVDKFVDSSMQHLSAQKAAQKANRLVIESRNNGDCNIYEYDSKFSMTDHQKAFQQELKMYLFAMKIYCDFQTGKPFQPDYVWPDLSS